MMLSAAVIMAIMGDFAIVSVRVSIVIIVIIMVSYLRVPGFFTPLN